jgi:hypothetical protein
MLAEFRVQESGKENMGTEGSIGSKASRQGSFAFLNAQRPESISPLKGPAEGEITNEELDTSVPAGGFLEIAKIPILELDEPKKSLQRDVNHVFRDVDKSTEYTLVALSSIAAILSFAELLSDTQSFAKASMWAHELSQDFISNTLKTVWDLLQIEIPEVTTLERLRTPSELKILLSHLISLREVNGVIPKFRFRKLYQKFTVIHEFFLLLDIHIFPNFANIHKEGIILLIRIKLRHIFCI